jgi:hypothetical protein
MKLDAALFCLWLVVLGLCMYFGPVARPWFEGTLGVWAAWLMALAGIAALLGAGWLWLRLPPDRRPRAAWGLMGVALGMGFLAWLQPILIERSHIILYGVLGALAWRLTGHWRQGGQGLVWSMLLAGAVGYVDEIGQWLHPDRMFDWRDVATNAAAGALGALAAWLLEPIKKLGPIKRRPL